jgi:hypothetical protein
MPTSHPILKQIALALAISAMTAISAIAAPAASGRPNSEPSRTAQSQTSTASLVVRPNPDQQIGQSDTVVRPNPDQQIGQSGIVVRPNPDQQIGQSVNDGNASTHTFAQTHTTLDPASPPGAGGPSLSTLEAIGNANVADPAGGAQPAIAAPSDDFDYGAAAIGAGITAAIAVLIAAGTLGPRQRNRIRHP